MRFIATSFADVLPWLILIGAAAGGWLIGWLARDRAPADPPAARRSVHLVPAAEVPSDALLALRRSVGLALIKHAPEWDIGLATVSPTASEARAFAVTADADELRLTPLEDGARGLDQSTTVLPSVLTYRAETSGEVVTAWLLSHWRDPVSADATRRLLHGPTHEDDPTSSLLLALAEQRRDPADASAPIRMEAALRGVLRRRPPDWPATDRMAAECLLASTLIADADRPAGAVRAYEALDLATRALAEYWSAGDIAKAAACQHLIARVRLTLARCESEPAHLSIANDCIAHSLAHRGRAADTGLHAEDLVLLAEIEQTLAAQEPGTTALVKAVAAAREALGLLAKESGRRPACLSLLAQGLIGLGEREASVARLGEAVAVARQAVDAHHSEATSDTLARSLLALGTLGGRRDLIEEAQSRAGDTSGEPARITEAECLEALGALSLDTAPLRAAVTIWQDLAASIRLRPEHVSRRCRCTMLAARMTSDPALLDAAIALAHERTAAPPVSTVATALDLRMLGQALLARASAVRDGRADAERAANCFSSALRHLAGEPLDEIKARIGDEHAEARRLAAIDDDFPVQAASSATAPRSTASETSAASELHLIQATLAATARLLDPTDAASEPRRLSDARRQVLSLVDRLAAQQSGATVDAALAWLDRIEQAQRR